MKALIRANKNTKKNCKSFKPGTIIGDGDRKSWDPQGPMIWHNFSIFRQIAPSLHHIFALIHALVVGSHVYVVTLHDQKLLMRVASFHSEGREIRQGRRTRALF